MGELTVNIMLLLPVEIGCHTIERVTDYGEFEIALQCVIIDQPLLNKIHRRQVLQCQRPTPLLLNTIERSLISQLKKRLERSTATARYAKENKLSVVANRHMYCPVAGIGIRSQQGAALVITQFMKCDRLS